MTSGTFGNSPRNVARGPGWVTFDLSLQREIRFTPRFNATLRWDIFNVFNRANFGLPERNITAATAGVISTLAGDPRVMQLSVRVAFLGTEERRDQSGTRQPPLELRRSTEAFGDRRKASSTARRIAKVLFQRILRDRRSLASIRVGPQGRLLYSEPMTAAKPIAGDYASDVVGLGANSVDYVHLLPGYPQPFGSYAKMKIERQEVLCGGQTATAMCACARLGLRARYAGVTGTDENGRRVRNELKRRGIDLTDVIIRDAQNQFAVILVDETNGDRIVLWDRDERLMMRDRDMPVEAIASTRVLHVDDVDQDAAIRAAEIARESWGDDDERYRSADGSHGRTDGGGIDSDLRAARPDPSERYQRSRTVAAGAASAASPNCSA